MEKIDDDSNEDDNNKKNNIEINHNDNSILNKDEKQNNKDNNLNKNEFINSLIQVILKKFNFENKLNISFKKLITKNNFYFSLRYYKNTSLNPFDNDICFSIALEDKEPYKIKYIKCLSNFCFPTFCDNRNLLKTIFYINESKEELNENLNKINTKLNDNLFDINNKYNDNIFSLENIIERIPYFIKEIKKNEEMKCFLKFGQDEYNIDEAYDINEFLIYENNKFFRVKQIIDELEIDRYVIITDIYLILMKPSEEFKNNGILIFYGFLHKLEKEETIDEKIIKINWKKNKRQNKMAITLKIEDKNYFCQIIDKKIQLLQKFNNIKLPNKQTK